MAQHPPQSYVSISARSQSVRRVRVSRALFAFLIPLLLASVLFVLGPVRGAIAQAPVPGTPTLSIDKSILGGLTSIDSGVPFKYVFAYRCASIDTNCLNATITDPLPAGLEFLGVELPPGVNTSASFDPATRKVSINFSPFLKAGDSGFIVMSVLFAPGTPPGTAITNTVGFTATNATAVTDKAPPITPTGAFKMFARKRVVSDPIVQGEPIEFALELCSPDAVGGVRFIGAQMVDTIPAAATFVGAQGVEGVDWTYVPATRKLTFLTVDDPAPVGGCVTRTMKLSYPVGATAITGESNALSITGTPEGCSIAPLPAYCQGQGERTLTTTKTFDVGVPFPSLDVTKSSAAASSFYGTEALVGEAVTYTVGAENDGFVNLTNVVVTDTIPSQFDLLDFSVAPHDGIAVSAFYRASNNPTLWVPLADNPYATATTINVSGLGLGAATIQALKWELGAMAHPGSTRWTSVIHGKVKAGTSVGSNFDNTANGSGVGPTPTNEVMTDVATSNVKVIDERAIPRAAKESSATGQVRPGDTITFTVRIKNEAVAHLPVENPVMGDLLPAQFEYVPGTLVVVSKPAGAPDGTLETIANYNSTGRMLLRASFLGSTPATYKLQPGEEIVIKYAVKVVDGTPPGIIQNKATIGGALFPAAPACPLDERGP